MNVAVIGDSYAYGDAYSTDLARPGSAAGHRSGSIAL
jgi:hypothetical protein